jgi:dCTP deaminase
MSVLPDHEIRLYSTGRKSPLIAPFNSMQLQPASYDVLLGARILVPTYDSTTSSPKVEHRTIELGQPIPDDLYREADITDGYVLHPGQFILGETFEMVHIPAHMVGRIEGKSSIGRLGLTAHITAGYLDPGFRGRITLEIANFFTRPIRLKPNCKIAQLGFEWMSSVCERPYGSEGLGSHYQGADGVQGSRYGD